MITAEIERLIVSHAIAEHPREACGLIGGHVDTCDGLAPEVTTIYPCSNAAADPEHTYVIDPRDQLEAEAAMQEAGETCLAVYHSHPNGPPTPSTFDTEIAKLRPNVAVVIVSLQYEALRVYVLDDDQLVDVTEPRPEEEPNDGARDPAA